MRAGRIIIVALLLTALAMGVGMWWLQVYAYYDELTPEQAGPVTLVLKGNEGGETIAASDLRAIDSESSPIRFRECFTTSEPLDALAQKFEAYEEPTPLNAPGWFDCFDAEAIGDALESGEGRAFLSVKDIRYGIDRVVAVLPDGRGFAWQQINACGEVVFNGEPAPEGCPPVPERLE
ncbi:Pyruvate carboxylase [Rubellimicrobium mesophilum DSM 19309]|uniref:Pyruvate carboxylase n=1 Tax=Rubellimicrobium mesophilum DSM 19309 TaxID=442562 RepID=A0A017HV91_9RHOB|nr:DUF6446 family protein [Rubellimicrobium mesophilum]EYD77669.1 Pyruvate carboxylase [Rubellimicrobium mesophilum DSM 19309]